MSNRPVSIGRLGAVLGALALALAGCGGAAAPSSSASSGATPQPPASDGPIVIPSFDIPSFEADVDLESKLPSTLCDQPTQKFSFTGAEFVANDEAFAGVVAALGRSPADVSLAGAGVAGPECAGINLLVFRVKGADGARFEELFINAQEADTGARPTRANVGGKDVWIVIDSGGTTSYIYFRGDTVFGVTAESEADAAKGLAAMP